jgi:NitT/TauT family transport system substrate-binding protein
MGRIRRVIPVFIIIIILYSSSFNLFKLIEAQISNEKPIEFSINIWAPNFLAYIAQEKGYFEKNNVNVKLSLIQNYRDAVKDYVNGENDGMFIVYSDALIQDSGGVETKVVFNTDTSNGADAIIGSVDNLTDVKGKKVGVEGINSFSHYFMLKSLEKVGLDEGDVEFVNIPAQNILGALEKGEIAAGHTYNPYMSDAIKDGFNILSIGTDVPGAVTTVIAFHSDIVEQRPMDIQNIIKSLLEAKEDYDKNTGEDIEIMSVKTGVNKTDIINGMNGAKLLDLDYNAQISMNKELNTTASLYNSGNSIAKFYAERGVISEYPNIEKIIEPKFVNELLMGKKSDSQK